MEKLSCRDWRPSVVLNTSCTSPSFILSTMLGRPSRTFFTVSWATPSAVRKAEVPAVAMTLKPWATRMRTGSRMNGLSASFTETNTAPDLGTVAPPAIWLLAKARAKAADRGSPSRRQSRPMTSPVERISGPSTVSTPGKRAKGNTASFTAMWSEEGPGRRNWASFSPAMTLAAMAATGAPMALATKGTVRDARGLTSSTKMRGSGEWGSSMANWTFISPRTFRARAISSVWRVSSAMVSGRRENGGREQAESPECTPASSICSMIPAT